MCFQSLTGNKDVDRLIISFLPDKDVLKVCQTNKYNYKICDTNFFHNLVMNRYQNTIKYKDSVKPRNWKNHFLTVVYYIGKLETEYNFDLRDFANTDISPELEYLSREILDKSKKYSKNHALRSASKNGHLQIVKYLGEQGADLYSKDDYALRWASINGHFPVVKFLVEHGANIDSRNGEALRFASREGYLEIVKYLVEHEANINSNNSESLRWASARGQLEIVKYLTKYGANIHAREDEALRWSKERGHTEVVKYLQSLQ